MNLHILQLLDISIIDAQTELIQFLLHTLNNLCLEQPPVVKQFLHRHIRHNTPRLTLNNALDNILHMITTSGDETLVVIATIAVFSQQHSVLLQALDLVVRTDGEDGGKRELQLLTCHGLQGHGEVEGRNGDLCEFLKRQEEAFFDDANFVHAGARYSWEEVSVDELLVVYLHEVEGDGEHT